MLRPSIHPSCRRCPRSAAAHAWSIVPPISTASRRILPPRWAVAKGVDRSTTAQSRNCRRSNLPTFSSLSTLPSLFEGSSLLAAPRPRTARQPARWLRAGSTCDGLSVQAFLPRRASGSLRPSDPPRSKGGCRAVMTPTATAKRRAPARWMVGGSAIELRRCASASPPG
jgi:hypothetical protein